MTRPTDGESTPQGIQRWAIRGTLIALVLLAVIAIGEVAARAVGREPWRVEDPGIVVRPGGQFFEPHPTLGYRHLPGAFDVTLRTGYTFRATHGPNTLRVTQRDHATNAAEGRPQIWIFGCSITYGWSVNDDETYPWLLQAQRPDAEIVNFGVNGYGTLHSLIQLRDALDDGPRPALVVLAYAQIHDERNTFTRTRRKSIAPWNRLGPLLQPYARLEDDRRLRIAMAEVEYAEFPAMRYSALSHWLEELYDRYERRALHSREVTLAIIEEFVSAARAHDVPVLLAGIRSPQLAEVLAWARQRGIAAADISVDNRDPRYVNLPHDTHPSPLAHREYAVKLHAAIAGLEQPE
jgi:hypothetical protein